MADLLIAFMLGWMGGLIQAGIQIKRHRRKRATPTEGNKDV